MPAVNISTNQISFAKIATWFVFHNRFKSKCQFFKKVKMKRNAFLCLLMIVAPLSVIAQSFNGAKLKGGVWYRNEVNDKERLTIVFTDTQFTRTYSECTFGPWDSESISYPYYLSDTIPTEFDNTKVGKSTKGKYLIWINLLDYRFYAETILELTDNSLKVINPGNFKITYTKKEK